MYLSDLFSSFLMCNNFLMFIELFKFNKLLRFNKLCKESINREKDESLMLKKEKL